MKSFAARKWFIVSIPFVALAFVTKCLAINNAGEAEVTMARATQDVADGRAAAIPDEAHNRATRLAQDADNFGTLSFSLMIVGGIFLAFSAVKREPVKRDVAVVFWVMCMICQFVTV